MKNNKKEKNNNIKKFIPIIVLAVFVFLVGIGYSLSAVSFDLPGNNKNTLKTSTLIISLDSTKDLDLVSAVPTADSDGISSDPYTFKISNTGTVDSKYQISIVDDEEKYTSDNCLDKKLANSKIKYTLTESETATENDVKTLPDDGIIKEDLVKVDSNKTYYLRVWIDSQAGNEVAGKHFHGKVKVKAIVGDRTNYDTGA